MTYMIANRDIITSIVKAAVEVSFSVRMPRGNEYHLPHADDRKAISMIA